MKQISLVLISILFASSITACGAINHNQPATTKVMSLAVSSQLPPNYYQAAQGLRGEALLHTLAGIASRRKSIGYERIRDFLFADVADLDNNNIVECAYTGRSLEKVSNFETAYRGETGLNVEHTWPQNMGAEGPAKSDLHHLFPVDIEANSKRSSFPFGEVVTATWSAGGSKLGRNANGETVFEPRDDQKGNTARAMFYFYTVYGQRANLSNFRIEKRSSINGTNRIPSQRKRAHVMTPFTEFRETATPLWIVLSLLKPWEHS